MHEYEFKSNMALSLMGFREVLQEDIPDDEQSKVGEFVIETMDKIYSNPQQNIDQNGQEGQDANQNPVPGGQAALAQAIKKLGP